MSRLCVLIVAWNAWPDLRRCLASIGADREAEFEVLVIDNASEDQTRENVQREFPRVRVVTITVNVGHTRSVNRGLGLIGSDYILLLDPDTEMTRESIDLLLRFVAANPDVGVAAPRTYYPDGSIQATARRFPSVLNGLFGRQSLLTRLFPGNRFSSRYLMSSNFETDEPFQVDWVSSACMMMRRSAVEETGLWDEGYWAYWGDADWCMSLHDVGKKVFCVPRASVVHHENYNAKKRKSPQRILTFHRGAYRFYRKYYTRGLLDPRSLIAAVTLGGRAALLIAANHFKPATVRVDP